jgi:hypothetical protein
MVDAAGALPAETKSITQGVHMTASKQIKGLLAGVAAFALIGTAMAQGNPPNPAIKNAPEGAGQRSTQNTPMGTTGTPTGSTGSTSSGMSNSGSTSGMSSGTTGTTGMSGSSNSGTTMGAGGSSSDAAMASSTTGTRKANRRMRADRN